MVRWPLGPRAELRILKERDADALFALTDQNRGSLRRWLPWVDATRSVNDTRQFIRAALQQYAAGDGFQAGIWSDGHLAGAVGYLYIDTANRRTELGYWLGDGFRGHGLMTQACRALVAYAFETLALQEVVIRAAVDNRASRAVAERVGFRLERIERASAAPDEPVDDLAIYAIRAGDWQAEVEPAPLP